MENIMKEEPVKIAHERTNQLLGATELTAATDVADVVSNILKDWNQLGEVV